MIIDFHTHIFPDKIAENVIARLEKIGNVKAFIKGTESALHQSMIENNVDVSVLLPVVTKVSQTESINRFAAGITEKYKEVQKGRLLSFGGVHPDSPTLKADIQQIKAYGLKGVKLHPDYQGIYFDDIRYMRALDYASEAGLISVVHAGVDIGYPDDVHCTPTMVKKVIHQVHPKNLVLAHTGGYDCWDEVEELLVGEDVFMDISFTLHRIGREQFCRILRRHGIERFLFGTDSPWSGQGKTQAMLNEMDLSEEEKEMIYWKNAARLLQLPEISY